MKTNVPVAGSRPRTHEGAPASRPKSPLDRLRRLCLTCMLWEDTFYVDGKTIAEQMAATIAECNPTDVLALAVEMRTKHHLRHAPLLLIREVVRTSKKTGARVAQALYDVILRPDEMAEFISIYWKDAPNTPIPSQVRKGLAMCFHKFDEYQFAKYDREGAIRLRDVMFLVHPKPTNADQAALFKRIAERQLKIPDTWEVALSGGADKKETFTRLLSDRKLGYMALLRNLRNMIQSGVNSDLIVGSLLHGAPNSRVLPFRFVAAARHAPSLEPHLDIAMQRSMASMTPLDGKTVLLIDVSGSMDSLLSAKSDLNRLDAASSLAVLVRGLCPDVRIFTFSNEIVEVPARNGMALIDAVCKSQGHGGTFLGAAVKKVHELMPDAVRLIVITDEQSSDAVPKPIIPLSYMLNVGTYVNGVSSGDWLKITGFSEAVLQYIQVIEDCGKAD